MSAVLLNGIPGRQFHCKRGVRQGDPLNPLGCNIASMPFTYLGLPLGTTKPTIYDLMPLVDRIERRVSATFMMMSYSGRVTLVNSLISSIATFAMCSIQLNPKNP
jgi:hypothetical protein